MGNLRSSHQAQAYETPPIDWNKLGNICEATKEIFCMPIKNIWDHLKLHILLDFWHVPCTSATWNFFLLRKKATISFLVTRLDRIIMGLLHCIRNQLQGTYLHIIISHAPWCHGVDTTSATGWRFLGFLFDFLLKWIFHSVSSHEFSLPLSLHTVVSKKSIPTT